MQKWNPASAACMFFLFFLLLHLLTTVSPQCRMATPTECQTNAKDVPGLDLASQGFDITRLRHTSLQVLDLSEWQLSNGSCTLCENPLLPGKPLQRLPLAIADWKPIISCQEKVQGSVYQSAISVAKAITELAVKGDWKKDLDVDASSSAGVQSAFTGTNSRMVYYMRRKALQDKYNFLLQHASCSYYKFRIKDKSIINYFNSSVQRLPEKYEPSSKEQYHNLIAFHGTHFVTDLDVGARVSYLTALPVCLMVLTGDTTSEISDCLEIEVGLTIGLEGVTSNPNFRKCKKKQQDESFRFLISEQLTDTEGGDSYSDFPDNTVEWLESAKSEPALLSYSLEPLHTLLTAGDPRRDSLQQAVSEYVRERALRRECTLPCSPGVQHAAWDDCSCECPNNNFTNSMCCPQKWGLAKLVVTIVSATGLWGDYITGSDGYVRVFVNNKIMCTKTVWNNNNPEWNVDLDFGIIEFQKDFSKLQVEVWDEDFGWDDDLLGKCLISIETWVSTEHSCFLDQGRLTYKYHLVCAPHLGGDSCRHYFRKLPNWKK
ncbi:hypothetical protein lerEdw1_020746 [Lerista edwardsae]|nr:hypothetical protein lerEdw1_020746 [Lerista edwardsae]